MSARDTMRPLAAPPTADEAMRRIAKMRRIKREWQREWRANPQNRRRERAQQREQYHNRTGNKGCMRRCFFCGFHGYCKLVDYVAPAKDGSSRAETVQVRWCGKC